MVASQLFGEGLKREITPFLLSNLVFAEMNHHHMKERETAER